MSNKRKVENLVDSDEVDCGGTLSEIQTISCRFGNFAHLPHKREEDDVTSRVLKCHGHKWKIIVYPGGDKLSSEKKVNITVYLQLLSKITDDVRVKFRLRAGPPTESGHSEKVFTYKGQNWGWVDYALRSNVLDPSKGYLDEEGALTVKFDIQIYMKDHPVFRPKKKLQLDMLRLFECPDSSDVTFLIGNSKFPVHSLILKHRAPTLASMAEDADGSEVVIPNIDSQVFRQLLRHVYGDELPSSSDMQRDARALLEAADRFGCTGMKLHVEAEVVQSILSKDNAADWVLFADSHSCALLKEAAISIFKRNSSAVMKSSGWASITESADIMKELMEALVSNKSEHESMEGGITKLSVSSLREKLEEKGLDVDGTREMLVERLKKATNKP